MSTPHISNLLQPIHHTNHFREFGFPTIVLLSKGCRCELVRKSVFPCQKVSFSCYKEA